MRMSAAQVGLGSTKNSACLAQSVLRARHALPFASAGSAAFGMPDP